MYSKLKRRRIFFMPENGFFWVTNPKAASSSMRAWILDNELGIQDGKTNGPEIATLQIANLEIEQFNELWGKHPKICVIRDPQKRFRSAYNNLINRRFNNQKRTKPRPKHQILEALGRKNSDLHDFVSLDDFVEALRRIDPKQLNLHFAPQVKSLQTELIDYDLMIKLEELDKGFAELQQKLGISINLKNYHKKQSKGNTAELEFRHREFVDEFYKQDFKILGYPNG